MWNAGIDSGTQIKDEWNRKKHAARWRKALIANLVAGIIVICDLA